MERLSAADSTLPSSRMTAAYVARSRRFAAVCVFLICSLAACSGEPSKPKPTPTKPPTAQESLEAATESLKDLETGTYTIQTTGFNSLVEGEFDMGEPYVSQSMTMPTPDNPDGFTVHTIAYKKEAFVGFSDGVLKKCFLRYEDADFDDALGLTEATGGEVSIADLKSTVPPVVELLMNPTADGFSKGNRDSIKAHVKLAEALSAALPKATYLFADSLDEKDRIPAILTLDDDGQFAGASYSLGDIFREAQIGADDIRQTDLLSKEYSPKQVLNMISTVQVSVTYEAFGRTVELERPKKRRIIEVDFNNIVEGATCKAAQQ